MDSAAREALQRISARPKIAPQTLHTILADTVGVVSWLRGRMVERDIFEEPTARGKQESKPPYRIAYMSAADREVEALTYWFDELCGYTPPGLYRVLGVPRGVRNDDLAPVDRMATGLILWLRHNTAPSDMWSHSRWGLWTVRNDHFNTFPGLAATFFSRPLYDDTAVDEVLGRAVAEQEALF